MARFQENGSKSPAGLENQRPIRRRIRWKAARRGFTLIELMITVAIIMILVSLGGMAFSAYLGKSQTTRAIQDIRAIQNAITSFQIIEGRLPANLAEVHCDTFTDPWGHPYQYTNFETAPKGKWRKDKFLVPINSTYDLWSMGPDGKSVAPLTAKFSHDDIIRANDGLFIGSASRY